MSGTTRQLSDPPPPKASAGQAPRPPKASAGQGSSYESYYGLVETPFSLTPGLRFTYNSRSHSSALAQIKQALERREGLMVVSGEVGTGKTMLCRALIQEQNPASFVSLVLDPCLTADEILEHVLTDFGVMNEEVGSFGRLAPAVPRHQMLILLQRFLASLIPARGRAVIVIDEAQHLRPEVLEQIRLWSNFETSDTKLLQIVLAGQSELEEVLRRPEMRQIQQRISRRCELTPLSHEEVAEYIEHRLWVARGFIVDPPSAFAEASASADASADRSPEQAASPVRFTPGAMQAVASMSGGIPRLVNLVCDRALEIACEQQVPQIDKRDVENAARRLNLIVKPESAPVREEIKFRLPVISRPSARTAAFLAGAAVLLVMTPFAWRSLPVSAASVAAEAAVAPAPAATATAGTLQTQQTFNVTVAVFRDGARARAVAAALMADGYPAFTRRDPAGAAFQLIVGPYMSPQAAAAARRALASHGISGTEMQLDNEHAGFAADVQYGTPADKPTPRGSAAAPSPKPPVEETPVAPSAQGPAVTYQGAVSPAIERLEQLAPFLVSAAASPDAPVLQALQETLMTLGRSVAAVDVPQASEHAHALLTSAISSATNAVASDFSGDRAAQTRHALDLLNQAKSGL